MATWGHRLPDHKENLRLRQLPRADWVAKQDWAHVTDHPPGTSSWHPKSCFGETKSDIILKSRDITLLTKVQSQSYVFFSSHVWIWELDHKEEHRGIDAFKLRCWRRLLRVIWTARRSNQSILGGNAPWIFTGRTDTEAEALILWPPDSKSLTGKDPDAWKDWGQAEKGMTEDEVVGWHHQLNGHEFEQTLGHSEG